MSNSKKKILILMSGSIACYKVCSLISTLVKNNFLVKVAASASALKFIGDATIEGLTGEKVHSDLWEKGSAMDHINLERWADLILAAPASSHFINRIASGIGDDLLTTIFLAHEFKKPFLIAPAMNTAMYLNPVTQKSISTLKSHGVQILETASGVLACGETGYGRLLEPDQLFQEILKYSASQIEWQNSQASTQSKNYDFEKAKLPRVLITAGGTREYLDDVRYLGNSSTGQSGLQLATYFSELGLDVTLALAQSSALIPESFYKTIRFDSFNSLRDLLKTELSENHFDWVFHLAAVSDFSLEKSEGKISSDEDLTLKLKRNPKIIEQIKNWSKNRDVKLVGFKLTSGISEKDIINKVSKIFNSAHADYVVQNDVRSLKDRSQHQFHIHTKNKVQTATGTTALAGYFSEIIGASL